MQHSAGPVFRGKSTQAWGEKAARRLCEGHIKNSPLVTLPRARLFGFLSAGVNIQ